MRRKFLLLFVLLAVLLLSSCGGNENRHSSDAIDIHSLQLDEIVSITGQKANATLVNNNTIWVQVQQPDKSFIMYHCQLADEFLKECSDIPMGTVVKCEGKFSNLMDLQQENTSPVVTLYECKIIK